MYFLTCYDWELNKNILWLKKNFTNFKIITILINTQVFLHENNHIGPNANNIIVESAVQHIKTNYFGLE